MMDYETISKLNFVRYLVKADYDGLCETSKTICACEDIKTANMLVELLSEKYKDRPAVTIYHKKIASNYIDFLDDENCDLWAEMFQMV